MVFIAILAIDMAVMRGLGHVLNPTARAGIWGVLPMADLLVVYLAIVVTRLVRRGEVALSGVAFLVFGGAALLLVLGVANLSPTLFWGYLNKTPYFVGKVTLALSLPILVSALLAGWATRGYRLKILKGSEGPGG
jgi:hypothetical protein